MAGYTVEPTTEGLKDLSVTLLNTLNNTGQALLMQVSIVTDVQIRLLQAEGPVEPSVVLAWISEAKEAALAVHDESLAWQKADDEAGRSYRASVGAE